MPTANILPQGNAALTAQLLFLADRVRVQTWDVTIAPATLNLRISAGARFRLAVEWVDGEGSPRDLTAWSAVMQIRQNAADAAALVDFAAVLTVGDTDGMIVVDATPAITALYTGWTRARYDLLATKTGESVRLLEGAVDLSAAVSR